MRPHTYRDRRFAGRQSWNRYSSWSRRLSCSWRSSGWRPARRCRRCAAGGSGPSPSTWSRRWWCTSARLPGIAGCPDSRWWHAEQLGAVPAAALGYLAITFVFYWWHRARHEVPLLWRWLHQVHHSAARIEVATSFYKHPVEILLNSLLSSFDPPRLSRAESDLRLAGGHDHRPRRTRLSQQPEYALLAGLRVPAPGKPSPASRDRPPPRQLFRPAAVGHRCSEPSTTRARVRANADSAASANDNCCACCSGDTRNEKA